MRNFHNQVQTFRKEVGIEKRQAIDRRPCWRLTTIPAEIVSKILIALGIGKYSIYELDSLLVTFNRPTELIGFIVNVIIGGSAGIIFYYFLEVLGKDYLILKGLAFGCVFWILSELVFTSTVEGKYIDIRPITDYYVHILGAAIFGGTLGLLIQTLIIDKQRIY